MQDTIIKSGSGFLVVREIIATAIPLYLNYKSVLWEPTPCIFPSEEIAEGFLLARQVMERRWRELNNLALSMAFNRIEPPPGDKCTEFQELYDSFRKSFGGTE